MPQTSRPGAERLRTSVSDESNAHVSETAIWKAQ